MTTLRAPAARGNPRARPAARPERGEAVIVEYRIGLGRWTTVHQLPNGEADLLVPAREDLTWLRPITPLI